jgi:hypothetical protein
MEGAGVVSADLRQALHDIKAVAIDFSRHEPDGTATLGMLANLAHDDGKVQCAIGLVLRAIRELVAPEDVGP